MSGIDVPGREEGSQDVPKATDQRQPARSRRWFGRRGKYRARRGEAGGLPSVLPPISGQAESSGPTSGDEPAAPAAPVRPSPRRSDLEVAVSAAELRTRVRRVRSGHGLTREPTEAASGVAATPSETSAEEQVVASASVEPTATAAAQNHLGDHDAEPASTNGVQTLLDGDPGDAASTASDPGDAAPATAPDGEEAEGAEVADPTAAEAPPRTSTWARPTGVAAFVLTALLVRPLLDAAKTRGVGRSVLQPASALAIAFVVIGGLWVFIRFFRRRGNGLSLLDIGTGGVAAAGFVSALNAQNQGGVIEFAVRLSAGVGMYIVLRRLLFDRRIRTGTLLTVLASAVALVVLYIAAGYVAGLDVVDDQRGTARLNGPFLLSNHLAHFLLPAVVIGIASFKHVVGVWRWIGSALTAAALGCLLLTLTMSAWIGLVVSVVIIGMIQSKRLLIAVPVAGLIFIALVPSALGRIADIDSDPDRPRTESSFAWRVDYWGEIADLNQNSRITGVGLGQVRPLMPQEKEPHNDYLRAYLEIGAVGLLAYVAMLAGFIRTGWVAMRRSSGGLARGLAVGFFAYAISFSIVSVAENLFVAVVTMWYITAFAALAEHAARTGDVPELRTFNTPEISAPKIRPRYVVLLLAAGGAAAFLLTRSEEPEPQTLLPINAPDLEVAAADEWPVTGRSFDRLIAEPSPALSGRAVPDLDLRWRTGIGGASFTAPAVANVDGRPMVFIGDQRGFANGYDAAAGNPVWSTDLGGNIASSPTVADGLVYLGSSRGQLHVLDAVTGATGCVIDTAGNIDAAPLVVDLWPDDPTRTMVYFSDAAGSGGLNAAQVVRTGAEIECTLVWTHRGQAGEPFGAGVAAAPAVGWDVSGDPLIVVGAQGDRGAVSAFDAASGDVRWTFTPDAEERPLRVLAGATVSPPGVNGFDGGVVYVPSADGSVYALDLTAGTLLWHAELGDGSPAQLESTPALAGDRLYVGFGEGVAALDVQTGATVWRSQDNGPTTAGIAAPPVAAGEPADGVVFVADAGGALAALDASDGRRLWWYGDIGGVRGGVSLVGGSVFTASTDGFLYRFDLEVGDEQPETTILAPVDGANPANPSGQLEVTGLASAEAGVQAVLVAVRSESTGDWWNDTAGRWQVEYVESQVPLVDPGFRRTNWSMDFPVDESGGEAWIIATTVDVAGVRAPDPAQSRIFIPSLGGPPATTIATPTTNEFFFIDGDRSDELTLTIGGTAADSKGEDVGVARVLVTIQNLDDRTFYCADTFCGQAEGEPGEWVRTFTRTPAELVGAGEPSAEWSITIPIANEAHRYRIEAISIDNDGERDLSPAIVERVCYLTAGQNQCS